MVSLLVAFQSLSLFLVVRIAQLASALMLRASIFNLEVMLASDPAQLDPTYMGVGEAAGVMRSFGAMMVGREPGVVGGTAQVRGLWPRGERGGGWGGKGRLNQGIGYLMRLRSSKYKD